MNDIIDNLPNIFSQTGAAVLPKKRKLYSNCSNIDFKKVRSAFGIALHMHQPTIPAGGGDLYRAGLISNLQYMFENQGIGDNYNAGVFFDCYQRMSRFIPELVAAGKSPRIMLDYSGNLLWGLRQINGGQALENLKRITCDKTYWPYVEWMGTMWSHSVVTSTPVPDIKLHMMAFRRHFASIFGKEAEERIKGFSAPEMHLPIHPDVCYEYVKALKECGYEWLMVQEHTVEDLNGRGISNPHLPHKLVAKNSMGETQEITCLIKTQGSDTKLVAQMQPLPEARGLSRREYCGKEVPPFVVQIGDGENGGVMMNEFPPMYMQCIQGLSTEGTVALNGSEYLEFLEDSGLNPGAYAPLQPISQHRIWEKIKKFEPEAVNKAITQLQAQDHSFNLDKGSWTNDRNWVKGYSDVLDPINHLSAAFHEKFDQKDADKNSRAYREALLYVLLSQTSCFRYWGQGIWTDYAKELCRRGMEIIGKGKTFTSSQPHVSSFERKKEPAMAPQAQNRLSKDLCNDPQVVQEIEKHKWYESEKAGRDVGYEWAKEDWIKQYGEIWKQSH
ncbi:MAG: glycosyl hydrolase family 57 [Candidatus Omnitrophica bacterium]|nr:glycosyl hydrolase family 57 [Candidatus Omnitrophota bacterium]MDE2008616.1 glycosyl hydrolase family 57 [Candidatus Omnitrophota bacterium]MDE2214082.1 glycosyl hydrolase family 57 [Candidatus Omnitrophota bacterium]MDE2230940.1 glycosyl hydrolase family 57 [Candidatus Omnitrophota bacterium]